MPGRPPRNYTVAEVADALRITIYYARTMCKDRKIPGAHKPAGQWLIDADTFDAWRQASFDKAAS